RVAYHGTPFNGWQLQPGRSTVQGEIEEVLTRRFHRRIPVVGAGRTDAGVHARGQAIHFDLFHDEIPFKPPTPPEILQHSMNRMMPLDIRMFHLQLAPYTPWHAIQRAQSKWYSYRLTLGPTLWNPMERFTRTHFVHLDMERLESILQLYVGTHDFGAFGGQLEQNAKKRNDGKRINTVRTVFRVELIQQEQLGFIGEEGNYRIDFLLKGALYKMVRNMVGTAMEVWLGRMKEEQLAELLKIPDRKDNPSKPAPPEGLTLECVYY
ncbi:hypothetical protein THAPSDRAFT_264420, partial [Thalassiosira pseudonana CCMP1335]